jgi:GT2 family glycosyltransferase
MENLLNTLDPAREPIRSANIPITAIVTAYQRIDQTLVTVRKLKACEPPPAEIIVHVDGNQRRCAAAVRAACPGVQVILSAANLGPGGGRNKLIAAAAHPIVASFDDDSYPLDPDYFARVAALFGRFPETSVICARVYHLGERVEPDAQTAEWVADFSGGACAYRRDHFSQTGGYVPLSMAYGMEEVDLALRLHARGGRVLHTSWLRVFHDTDRARHADPRVTAASIANLALLTYLRYPVALWAVGVGQCLNRIPWLLRNGRHQGIMTGVVTIPSLLLKHRGHVSRLSAKTVLSYLHLRRGGVPVRWNLSETQFEEMTSTTAPA